MSERDLYRVVSKQPPHRLPCRVGLLRPATLRDRFIKDGVQQYDFHQGQLNWHRYATHPGIVLNREVRTTPYGPGSRGLLLLLKDDTIQYALGGLTTGWQTASEILRDPSDIVIPDSHLQDYVPTGDVESLKVRDSCIHPYEVDEALLALRTIQYERYRPAG